MEFDRKARYDAAMSIDPHLENFGWTAAAAEGTAHVVAKVVELVRAASPRTVLDAGCGVGAVAAEIARAGFAVTGIDADAEGIRIASTLYPQVDFRVGTFEQPGERYDLVVSTEVIEHLYAPELLVRFARESLDPGGRFIVTTPYHGYWKNLALAVSGKMDAHFTVDWPGGHIKFFSRRTLTALLEREGFTVTAFHGIGRAPFLWKSMVLVAALR